MRVVAVGERLQAINHIALESYLPSVVGSEMPAQWPLAALRAQAVAARTYAMAQRRPRQLFDLQANVASQMYKGVEAETVSTRQAVAQTNGQVLLYRGRLIDAVFHSSSGGNTENSGEIWNRQLPYLTSVPDFDQISPLHSWSQFFSPRELRRAFAEIGGVTAIEPMVTSTSGRIRQARVIGPEGQLLLSGAELRRRLGLRSTLVRFQLVAPERPRATTLAVSAAVEQATVAGGNPRVPFPGLKSPPPPPPPLNGLTVSRQVVEDSLGGRLAKGQPLLPSLVSPGSVQPALPPSLLAVGRGFGHGVGMSQWGAYGMALRGKSHAEILRHYYRGAELGLGSL
jgi:stage II sporulation protein D